MTRYKAVLTALIVLALMRTLCSAQSGIYFYIDEDGNHYYSDAPTSDRYVPSDIGFFKNPSALPESRPNDTYDDIIRKAAQYHGVDFALVKAVIKAESDFNPYAVSSAGAQGLMQIMPSNFKSFDLDDPFDPERNITAGTRYLKYLIDRYNQDLHLALAAYNAGPGIVDRYGDIPPFRETRGYVKRVLSYYDRFIHGR